MTERVRPGTIRPFTREDVFNALARAGAKAVARAQALGLEPVIRSQEEALRDWEKEKSERAAALLSRSQGA